MVTLLHKASLGSCIYSKAIEIVYQADFIVEQYLKMNQWSNPHIEWSIVFEDSARGI